MTRAERPLPDAERALEQGARRRVLTHEVEQIAEIVEGDCRQRVLGARRLLPDGQRALEQAASLGVDFESLAGAIDVEGLTGGVDEFAAGAGETVSGLGEQVSDLGSGFTLPGLDDLFGR